MGALFEVWHGEVWQTDALDMDHAIGYCQLWEGLGLTNLTFRRKADGRTWLWN